MTSVLWYLLIPLIINGIAAGIAAFLLRGKVRFSEILPRAGIAYAVCVLLFALLHALVMLLYAANSTPFPPAAVAAISACVAFSLLIPALFKLTRIRRPAVIRFARQVGTIALAVLLFEILIANGSSLCLVYDAVEVPAADMTASDKAHLYETAAVIPDGGTVTVQRSCDGVSAVGLRFEPLDNPVKLRIDVKDDNFSAQFKTVIERTIRTDTGEVFLPLNIYGALHELQIYVSDAEQPLTLYNVQLANAMPFSASGARMIVLIAIGTLIAAVVTGKLYRLRYDRENRRHKAAVAVCFGVCVALAASLLVPYFAPSKALQAKYADSEDTPAALAYPLENIGSKDPYAQQFDAFLKGQLHLDLEPTEELLALENPYDNSVRSENGVYYHWDRAFYEGKYYSYFGIAPVLTFYYPFYQVTGMIPRTEVAGGFFAIAAIAFLFLTVLRLVKMYCGKVNLLLLLLGLLTTVGASGIFWSHLQSTFYGLPVLSGFCFLFMALWAGLYAYDAENPRVQIVFFALCAAAVCLTVASRPTLVLSALLLAPAFIHILVRKDYSRRRKLACAAAFLIPLGVGAVLIMVFNALRFGSPLEFGATYQLTVSNIAANTVSLSLLPAALYHYFLQPPSVNGHFPFVHQTLTNLNNYGRYTYHETTIGALMFPHLLASLAGLPAVVKRNIKHRPVKAWTLMLSPALALLAAFVGFCMGGVTLRYTADFLPLLCITALPLFLEIYHRLSKLPRLSDRHFLLFAALLVGSLVLSLCVALTCAQYDVAKTLYPQLLPTLADIVAFWR